MRKSALAVACLVLAASTSMAMGQGNSEFTVSAGGVFTEITVDGHYDSNYGMWNHGKAKAQIFHWPDIYETLGSTYGYWGANGMTSGDHDPLGLALHSRVSWDAGECQSYMTIDGYLTIEEVGLVTVTGEATDNWYGDDWYVRIADMGVGGAGTMIELEPGSLTGQATLFGGHAYYFVLYSNVDALATAGSGSLDVQFTAVPVPEPAPMGLLSLGGLALLRRRR